MSALSEGNWLAAEEGFYGIISHLEKPTQEACRALDVFPFRQRALAYVEALDAAQAAATLGIPPEAVEPFGRLWFLYSCALKQAGVGFREPAEVKHFPNLKGRRELDEAWAQCRKLNAAALAQLQELQAAHDIDPGTTK